MPTHEALPADQSALLSDTALAALALQDQPFAADTADGETFTDDTTAEQLSDIRQALITGDDLLLILGEHGAGKSTLLNQLAANSGLRIQCFSVNGGPRFSTRNLFMGMLEAFKIEPPDDLKATLDELVPCLQAMIAGNKLCVVVLDDAEALAEHELTTLLSGMLYVNSRDESLLRIALSAEPAFEERIPDLLPQGADLPYSSLALEPYDDERATAYLEYRFARVGHTGDLPFTERDIAALNEHAQGRPGALHLAAAASLGHVHGQPGPGAAAAMSEHPAAVTDTMDIDGDLPEELRKKPRFAALRGLLSGRGSKLGMGAVAAALIVGGLLLFKPSPEPGSNEARYRLVEQRKVETERESDRLRLLEEQRAARDASIASASAESPGPQSPDPESPGPESPGPQSPDADSLSADAAGGTTASGTASGSESLAGGAANAVSAGAAAGTSALSESARSAAATLQSDATAAAERTSDAGAATAVAAEAGLTDIARATEQVSETAAVATASAGTDANTAADPVTGDSPVIIEQAAVARALEGANPAAESAIESATETSSTPAAAPGATAIAATASANAEASAGATQTDVALLSTDAAAPSAGAETAVASEPAPGGLLESPNWVLVQNPDLYTVQMSASTDQASVEQFLNRTDLPAPNSIFQFDRDGRTWFALVHGLYPTITDARLAIERMPAEAQVNQPWIRAVSRIQETLRQ